MTAGAVRMAISFAQLQVAEPSPTARRLFWHVLSIGAVWRNEPERHDGLDKAGLFLFRVTSGKGQLEMSGGSFQLERGRDCWLVDLRQARSYPPAGGRTLRTEGVRFNGPGVEFWLELLGRNPVFRLPADALQRRLMRVRRLLRGRAPQFEWRIHVELTELGGELLESGRALNQTQANVPLPVARVLAAVLGDPARDWRVRELAGLAGVSYSRLREMFQASQGGTLNDFLRKTRLDLARRLLGDPRLSVKEVARRLNFSSESHFSRFFQRGSGMSPTRFRERWRA